MDNLFKKGREQNWIKFFENDRIMMTQALVMCKTGVVKVDLPKKDYTNEPLWQKITNEQKNRLG